jgi:hypothetical protein
MMVELSSTFPEIMGSNLADALGWEKMVLKKVNVLQDFELDSVNRIIFWSFFVSYTISVLWKKYIYNSKTVQLTKRRT